MSLQLQFSGPLFHWAGPAPHVFVAVPEAEAAAIRDLSQLVTYGWGMVPAQVQIGGTTFKTSLFPKDGGYLVPVKVKVRRAEGLEAGQTVTLALTVG